MSPSRGGAPTSTTPSAGPSPAARTLAELLLDSTRRQTGVALRVRRGDTMVDTTYPELERQASEVARGLIALGVEPGDRVGILANTRPEWTIADFGALLAGAVVVPVYHTNSARECQYVLEHSQTKVLFAEDGDQCVKIAEARAALPALEHVVVLDGEAEAAMPLAELRAAGSAIGEDVPAEIQRRIDPGDVATIVYTSGTTGPPKGCMTTHANLVSTVAMYRRQVPVRDHLVIFMFLPLAHSLARVVELFALAAGGTLAFWQGDANKALEDIQAARPTHFPSVPRIFEKIHQKALASALDGPAVKRAIFKWAVAVGTERAALGRSGRPTPSWLRLRHEIADRLVLRKVRDLFGGDLELALTGAAPMRTDVLEFFQACGVLVLEGYGLTESTAAATLNTPDAYRFGTVGRPLPGAEVRIADDGEVLLRGPNIFAGYHRDEAATEATMAGDWLRTGDLGELEDGFLRIVGRKKDLIITSSGKNIAPVNIESALMESRWVSQAVVYGDDRPYLVALLTLDPDEAPALAERLGIAADVAAMAQHPEVRAELQREIDAANAQFARIEQIKRFDVLERDLTQADDELTPTMKVKRSRVYGIHRGRFERLYD